MHPIKQKSFFLISTLVFLFIAGTSAGKTGGLSSVTVTAASLVPSEETRYIVKFRTEAPLELSKGASIKVELPQGFRITQDDILAADPGCTLAKLEYKSPGDQFYGVVRGVTEVVETSGGVQFTFIPQTERLVIPARTDIYLTLPGVINPPVTGRNRLDLTIKDTHHALYQGVGQFNLGWPPPAGPRQVRLVEATSREVRLAWDPVPGAERYRVLFSSRPDGYFISALDLAREPNPGEDWQLTDTTHSFTGRGNGGLLPGRTYYFKVEAGNKAGFCTASDILRVTLPAIKLKNSLSGQQERTVVQPGDTPTIELDQPARIADRDALAVYEKSSGIKVEEVQVQIDDADSSLLRATGTMQAGREYLVVFHEGALESRVHPKVVNSTFGWTVKIDNEGQGGVK